MPRARTAVAIATAVLLVAGCSSSSGGGGSPQSSSSSSTSTSTSTGTATVCSDYQALKDSVSRLLQTNPLSAGIGGLQAAVDDVTSKASALAGASGNHLAPQVDALKNALGQLADTLKTVPSGGLASVLSTVRVRLTAVGEAAQALGRAVTGDCPTASSS